MKVSPRPTNIVKKLPALLRVRSPGNLVCQILTDDPLVVHVHHVDRRTVPCMGDQCLFCETDQPQSQRLVLPICNQHNGRYALLDLPSSIWFHLSEHREEYKLIQPYIWAFRRKYAANNAPIDVRCRPIRTTDHRMNPKIDYLSEWELIHYPNLQFALQKIETAKKASGK